MNRTAVGVGIVAVLAIVLAIVVFSGGGDTTATTTTTTIAAAPSTTAPPPTTTTTVPPSTTTSAPPTTTSDGQTAREAEVEALVKELDLAFWRAIYDEDLEALADVVGGQTLYEAGAEIVDAGGDFLAMPTRDSLSVTLASVKLDRDDCIVADIDEDIEAFRISPTRPKQILFVMWPVEGAATGWRIATQWAAGTPESVWISDCDILDRTWRP